MRTAPLNYLLAFALSGLMWFLTGILMANWMGDNVSLAQMTVDEFIGTFRLALTVAAALGFVLTAVWFSYGAKPNVAAKLPEARRFWTTLFVVSLAVALVAIVALVLLFGSEQLAATDYLVFFVAVTLVTWLSFWISSLLWSPTQVMNTVMGRR